MTKQLFLHDAYLKECEATVTKVTDEKFIQLDQTIFYPKGGGQPHDEGTLTRVSDNKIFKVLFVGKFDGDISHEVEPGLQEGDVVMAKLDWDRRYAHMKSHTAAHIVAEASFKNGGALITGNQLSAEENRIDGNFDYSPEYIEKVFKEANNVVEKDLPIEVTFLPRVEAEKMPNMTKLAKGLPKSIKEVRIVAIGDYDVQADGGTHVKSTKEVGKITFTKYNSKGKNNKRIYFKVE